MRHTILLAPLLVSMFIPWAVAAASEKSDESKAGFALGLLRRLEPQDGNLIYSPYSVGSALRLAADGASGETLKEMEDALAGFHYAPFEAGSALDSAQGLWIQEGFTVIPGYLRAAREKYGAEIRLTDFRSDPAGAAAGINGWVSQKTRGKIPRLLEGRPDPDLRLFIANAVYFKGSWTEGFPKEDTKPMPFTLSGGRRVYVPVMFQVADFRYAEDTSLQALEMAYKEGTLSMVVLLPRDIAGLPKLEASLDAPSLERILSQLRRHEVQVHLPRFRFESSFQMNRPLSAMGMARAFSASQADFSRMTGGKDLFIGVVAHKALVELDEEGTEAAAATGIGLELTAVPSQPEEKIVFRADHPFLFLIRDRETGTILFLGRVADPSRS